MLYGGIVEILNYCIKVVPFFLYELHVFQKNNYLFTSNLYIHEIYNTGSIFLNPSNALVLAIRNIPIVNTHIHFF